MFSMREKPVAPSLWVGGGFDQVGGGRWNWPPANGTLRVGALRHGGLFPSGQKIG